MWNEDGPTPFERARQQAFEAEALPHLRALRAAAHRATRSVQDAEDLVQETFLRAYRAYDQYTPGTNIRAWLFTILRRVRTDDLRRAARRPLTVGLSSEPVSPRGQAPLASEELERALRRLPSAFRAAVVLRDFEGHSYQDIADALQIPIGTVMSRVHRGRAQLRSALGGDPPLQHDAVGPAG